MYQLLHANFSDIIDKINNFIDFLKNLEISAYDIADIILLTVFFALFVIFAKRKMVSSAMLGMGIFYVLLAIASILPLPGTSMIASSMLQIGTIAFVVLFHTEIRDLFEKIGSNPRLKLFRSEESNKFNYQIIDNVCSAVRELSDTKTGALIVMARTTQLDDVTSTGVPINADVNSYLLRNLFYNKAPLHDGAIVIDEGRIVSAGCILPLTRRKDFDGDLGTRHKAAIGLCEISDAIIIVVSEETGTISVAMDYSLTRDYTPDTLRKFLVTNILQDSDIE